MFFSGNSLHANASFLGISQHDRILPLFVLPVFFAVSAVFLKARGVKASGGQLQRTELEEEICEKENGQINEPKTNNNKKKKKNALKLLHVLRTDDCSAATI